MSGRRKVVRHATGRAAPLLAGLLALCAACASPQRPAIGENDLPGITEADWLALRSASLFDEAFRETLQRRVLAAPDDGEPVEVEVLALSGGGQYGAFGAGILAAWPRAGDGAEGGIERPRFDLVTGVSAGAMQATAAFLDDPQLDAGLLELFSTLGDDTVYESFSIFSVFSRSGLARYVGLAGTIEDFYSDAVIDRVAAEYEHGRTLWVGTTNLDTGRFNAWNLTHVAWRARAGNPDFYRLYRRLLLASASIPIAFEPQFVYGYMHADGAVVRNIFVPDVLEGTEDLIRDGRISLRFHLLVNGRLEVAAREQAPSTLSIGGRALDLLMTENTYGSIVLARDAFLRFLRDHPDVDDAAFSARLAFIPREFTAQPDPDAAFDTAFMRELAAFGREFAERSMWVSRLPQSALDPESTLLQTAPSQP